MRIRTALLSVHDKTGIVDFARDLARQGVKILSTGGTARALRRAEIPLTEVSEHTGSPEIMDGRVKTLHPRIHGGILAVRDNPDHVRQAAEQGIEPIDLVAVNLYPFREVAARPNVTEEEAIENIDIGGPSLVRAAAKNHRYVTVVTEPTDYPRVLEAMAEGGGSVRESLRRELAHRAFAHTAEYDAAVASWFGGGAEFPDPLILSCRRIGDLRYGENPHQRAAWYRLGGGGVAGAKARGGKELSYNNILDLDSALETVRSVRVAGGRARAACVVVKHNNPCGAARADSLRDAFLAAIDGDPVSAFGGVVAFGTALDLPTAEAMTEPDRFFEGVIAPGFESDVVERLQTRTKWGKNLRIVDAGPWVPDEAAMTVRGIRGGVLCQTADVLGEVRMEAKTIEPREEDRRDLLFAWHVCAHVRSNAIVLAKDEKVVGVGAGQMSRVDAAFLAVRKAGDRARGAVAASDAFFPFPDALEILLDAGVSAVIQPGGSIRDQAAIEAASKRGVPMVFTGERHFRH